MHGDGLSYYNPCLIYLNIKYIDKSLYFYSFIYTNIYYLLI